MRVVIPAAGLGKRFLPLSKVVPKELLLLGDRPVLHHALDEAARGGFDGAVVVVAPWKRPLFEAYLAAASPPLAKVELVDQPDAAGIGDAVLLAAPLAGSRFGVMLPDDVILESLHWRRLLSAETAAVCVRPVPPEEVGRFGIVEVRAGRAVRVVEKPAPGTVESNLGILGRYLVDGRVLEALERLRAAPRGDELQITHGLAAVPDLRVVEFEGEIYDCGTPDAYIEAAARWFERTRSTSRPAT